jgi:16S rRNA (guanine527-N7)-methyltransferase
MTLRSCDTLDAFHVKQDRGAVNNTDTLVGKRLEHFTSLLLAWNSRINLLAEHDVDVIHQRHIADSLQLAPLLPPGDGPVADLGSGGGLPGLVLAIAAPRPFHLVEADRRKAAFLTEAAAQLRLDHVRVHPTRIERAELPPLSVVTARALASLPVLVGYAARLLAPGGIAIFPKGQLPESELTEARTRWTFDLERVVSMTEKTATILRLSNIEAR